MRNDNINSKIPFKASNAWIEANKLFDQEFLNVNFTDKGIEGFRESVFNRKFSGFAIGNRKIFEMFLFMYYNKLKDRDKFNIIDKISEPDDTISEFFMLGEQKLSVDLLSAADNILTIAEEYPKILTEELVVADLGSGWGNNGYLLKTLNPKIKYLIFDLPEALSLAQSYLPYFFIDNKIEFYKNNLTELSREELLSNDIRFFGAHQLEMIKDKSIDIFINVSSFQEMTLTQITKYFDYIDKKVNGYLYTKNYIKWYNPVDDIILSLEDYPWLPNWNKKILRKSDNFNNHFVALYKINKF